MKLFEDNLAFRDLLRVYSGTEYPCQIICGVDNSDHGVITVHFDDLKGNMRFETIFFSSQDSAKEAFALLKTVDEKLNEHLPF